MAVSWYLEVEAPNVGALNEKLAEMGVTSHASEGGRLGYEVHYWTGRDAAQDVADALTRAGYTARVEAKRA